MSSVLSFDAFCSLVRSELDVDEPLARDTRLREDLLLDSLAILVVALLVEQIAPIGESANVTAEIDTLGELYTACVAGVIGGTVAADGLSGRDPA